MKKRTYIVAAMAVAMSALVGCQKDFDPAVEVDQATDLAARPVIGSPALVLGAETRATVTSGTDVSWKWEAGDQVGAMLVDEVNVPSDGLEFFAKDGSEYKSAKWSYSDYVKGTKTYLLSSGNKDVPFSSVFKKIGDTYVAAPSQDFYTRTQWIWTNYPYERGDNGVFTTPATLVEGHYVFYAPYNAGNGTRGPLVVTLPKEQTVTKAEPTKAIADFYANEQGYPVVLGMQYLGASETSSVTVPTDHIFAYPKITIKNNYEGFLFDGKKAQVANQAGNGKTIERFISTDVAAEYTMTIKQIQLYSGNPSNFAYQSEVQIADVSSEAAGLYAAVTAEEDTDRWVLDVRKDHVYQTAPTSAIMSTTTNYGETVAYPNAKAPVFDGEMKTPETMTALNQCVVINFEDVELENGEEFAFNAVVPAENYEKGLFARILVTIDGKDYYIVTNDIDNDGKYDPTKTAVYEVDEARVNGGTDEKLLGYGYTVDVTTLVPAGAGDYRFTDRNNKGSNDLVLVRGQRYPAAEVNEDLQYGSQVKAHAGNLMTIELVGGTTQAAFAAAVDPEKPEVGGIKDNPGFIDYLSKVNQNAELTQVENEADTKDNANKFFLNPNHEVILNAELIEALARTQKSKTITFIDNLPIGADVLVNGSETEYTFTAGDYSYPISYKEAPNAFNGKVGTGINRVNVSTATELEMADGAANAVVFVDSDNVTLKNPAGINGIVVADGKTLTVSATADVAAWIVAGEEATIDIKAGSKGLTNPNNDFTEATVNNQALATVAGEVGTVSYENLGFIKDVIPAATQINFVTINAKTSTTNLKTEQADFEFAANLKKVTINFGTNIKSLKSDADIKLGDNIADVIATNPVDWTSDDTVTGVTVSLAKGATHYNITSSDNTVTFDVRQ